jgi:hypothetical protein
VKVLVDTSVWSLAFRKQPKTEGQQGIINELAASFSNQCRRQGIQGSQMDCLICAVGFKNSF